MNALSEDFWGTIDGKAADKGGILVRETHWGFIARQDDGGIEIKMEMILKIVSLVLVPVGAAMLILGDQPSLSGVPLADIGLPMAFIVTGLALFLHASRGFRREIQVDALKREVRVGVVNSGGSFRCRQAFGARDIDSAFLLRSRMSSRPSKLNLRLRDKARPVLLLEASENVLQPVFERTAAALKKREARKTTSKPKKTGRRRSLMSLPLWKKRAQTFDPK